MLMTYVGWKLEINSCFSSAQSDWHWCYSYINHIRGWRTEHSRVRGRDGRGQHPHAGAQWGQSGLEAAPLLGEAPAGRLREPRLLPRPRPGDEGGLGQHIRQAAGGLHWLPAGEPLHHHQRADWQRQQQRGGLLHVWYWIFHLAIQLRRLTLLNVLEKDSYMNDMINLLSNFKFGESIHN